MKRQRTAAHATMKETAASFVAGGWPYADFKVGIVPDCMARSLCSCDAARRDSLQQKQTTNSSPTSTRTTQIAINTTCMILDHLIVRNLAMWPSIRRHGSELLSERVTAWTYGRHGLEET